MGGGWTQSPISEPGASSPGVPLPSSSLCPGLASAPTVPPCPPRTPGARATFGVFLHILFLLLEKKNRTTGSANRTCPTPTLTPHLLQPHGSPHRVPAPPQQSLPTPSYYTRHITYLYKYRPPSPPYNTALGPSPLGLRIGAATPRRPSKEQGCTLADNAAGWEVTPAGASCWGAVLLAKPTYFCPREAPLPQDRICAHSHHPRSGQSPPTLYPDPQQGKRIDGC